MYTVRIPIHTSEVDEHYFAKCFFYAWIIRNSVTAYASRMLNALYSDRAYRNAREEYGRKYSGLSADEVRRLSASEKANRKRLAAVMNSCQLKYHLSKSALEKYAAVQQHKCAKYLFSHQVQAIAKNVYTGVEKVLYSQGKELGFARYNDFDTISQKDLSGVSLIDWNHIRYRKKVFRLKTPDTRYMQMVENAHQRIVLCALKRIEFESGWRYYVIVTLDGDPPVMQQKSSTPDRIGVDIGTSTFAAASGQKVMLANLAPYAVNYEKQIRHLQKQIDHIISNAEDITKRGRKVMDKIGKVSDIDVKANIDVLYSGSEHDWTTNAALDLYKSPHRYITLGVDDIGGRNSTVATVGRIKRHFGARAGIIDNKPGFGVDMFGGKRFKFSADASDFDDMELRLLTVYNIADDTAIMAQWNNVNHSDDRAAYFGIRQSF